MSGQSQSFLGITSTFPGVNASLLKDTTWRTKLGCESTLHGLVSMMFNSLSNTFFVSHLWHSFKATRVFEKK